MWILSSAWENCSLSTGEDTETLLRESRRDLLSADDETVAGDFGPCLDALLSAILNETGEHPQHDDGKENDEVVNRVPEQRKGDSVYSSGLAWRPPRHVLPAYLAGIRQTQH